MSTPVYPIKYEAPEGHTLQKATVPPGSTPVSLDEETRELPLAGVTQKYPLG